MLLFITFYIFTTKAGFPVTGPFGLIASHRQVEQDPVVAVYVADARV